MVDVRFVNDTTPIRVTSETQVKSISVKSTMGTDNHNLLSNRDLPDQHPISAITGLQEALLEKQDVLTAGENIQIENGVISATDTTYTAGTGINIVGNVISNTQTSAEWGNIGGDINAQTDLQNALNGKADISDIPTKTSDLTNDSGFITNAALDGYATQNYVDTGLNGKQDTISDLATIRSGAALGATALQPNDNISELNNDAGYITSADLPTVNNSTITFTQGGTTKGTITLNQSSNQTIAFDAGGGSDVEAFTASEVQTIWESV